MNILDIIDRVKKSCSYGSDASLARALNMSPQNFNSQKKTGKIKDTLMLHAIERGINIDWIKTGHGSMITGHGSSSISEPHADYSASHRTPPESSYPDHLVHKTRTVLTSDTVFRRALDSNIEAFHEAVTMKEQLAATKAALSQCIDQINLLKNEIELLKGDRDKKAV